MEFDELDAVLQRAGLVTDAAEVHGTLCGMICSGIEDSRNLWMGLVFEEADPDNAAVGSCATELRRLHEHTRVLFASDGFEIQPLLPDDNENLEVRAESLAAWCQGFLYGLSLCEFPSDQVPPQVQEVIADFAEISRAGVDSQGEDEESEIDENAYTELIEYVRVSMQLIYEELLGGSEPVQQGERTVH